MAPTETSQTENMSPAGKLRSLQGDCQPCPQKHYHDNNKSCPGSLHQQQQQHNNSNNDNTIDNSNIVVQRKTNNTTTTTKADIPKPHTEDTDLKKKAQDDDAVEAKLWNVGCKSAVFTLFLYTYGNNMVMGEVPKDPRVDSWLFMQSPAPTLFFSLAYIAFCTYVGPRVMRDREPPKGLKQIMILYNAFQVVFSFWMFYEGGMAGWFGSYSYICQPCDFSNSPQALRMLNAALWYNLSKFVDFLDTIFFVLNKKYSHISLLHVTHHSLMPLGIWYGLRHEAGGQTTFFGFLNCFVHTVMYLYYLLAAMGPRVRPFLWWKKYLTKLQMVQFVIMFVHALMSMAIGCQAGAPLMRIIMVMAFIFQLLFTDFYIKAYLKRAKSQNKDKAISFPIFCNTFNNMGPKTLQNHTLHKKVIDQEPTPDSSSTPTGQQNVRHSSLNSH